MDENELASACMRVKGLVWRNVWLTVLPDDIPLLKQMDPTDTVVFENSVISPFGQILTLHATNVQAIRSRFSFTLIGQRYERIVLPECKFLQLQNCQGIDMVDFTKLRNLKRLKITFCTHNFYGDCELSEKLD